MEKARHSEQYANFLAALRQARKNAGLTQTEVAGHFGSHASFVSKCETGERRVDVVELAAFCRLYGVHISSFLKSAGLD